jgi:hypothetical protein
VSTSWRNDISVRGPSQASEAQPASNSKENDFPGLGIASRLPACPYNIFLKHFGVKKNLRNRTKVVRMKEKYCEEKQEIKQYHYG